MVVNRRPVKRAKRRVTADLCDFLNFPAPGDGISDGLDGPFRVSVREFLVRHARLPPPSSILLPSAVASPHLIPWRITLRVGDLEGAVVELNVVEEDVLRSKSIYCDHCRIVGWSGHPVCGKRYHFIIRNDSKSSCGCRQTCMHCETLLPLPDTRCIKCKYEMRGEDLEDWPYVRLEDSTHLLHGVVHANGYGHLLRVNGREGGSKYLTGCDIMGFWDRICKMLHVRKVSVLDISKKYGMEYRLLHAVTAGRPWYGDWGYRFGAGSFALTAVAYQKAVETLSNIPLSVFFCHARSPRTPLQNVIALYRSMSDHQLVTVGNLFCYVTRLLHESREQRKPENPLSKWAEATSGVSGTWTNEDVERAEKAMVKVLRAVGGSKWVTWRALRGATFQAIKSPELLDHCLKELGGKAIGDGTVVAARRNAETSAIEYRLEAASNQTMTTRYLSRPSADQLLQDLKFLYDALLSPATMQSYRPQATEEAASSSASKLLDCKQFIKHYDEPASNQLPSGQSMLPIWCHVELIDHPKGYTTPPPELLILPMTATIADLKQQATRAFQETYLIFQRFQAEQLILDRGDVSDFALVRHILGLNEIARIRGTCSGVDQRFGQFRMERGLENWIVDCDCGAKDDDGERMMACDACGVWQHTRCAGISDHDEVPAKYVCRKCIRFRKSKGRSGGPMKRNSSGGMCKDETEPSKSGRFGSLTTVR
ncbi:PHD finger protein At1g33420-like [Phoenix dactylifera]|uniref:PHD finger protein At1g33420-like n=1 Tax=Phoenix dactylifera TaxID=42345 RepID=A0A8B7CNG3_PHODC|nr:PHD finger protein At1g33420-like [Phoenix dactylifera]